MPPMDSTTSLRVAIVGPKANLIPSSILATSTPDDSSTDMPSASSTDHTPPAGNPSYRHVTTPTAGSSRGATTRFKQFDCTYTSLSVITQYAADAAATIFSSANTFAFGYSGSPDRTTVAFTCGYL